jgi:hypothetical protein
MIALRDSHGIQMDNLANKITFSGSLKPGQARYQLISPHN